MWCGAAHIVRGGTQVMTAPKKNQDSPDLGEGCRIGTTELQGNGVLCLIKSGQPGTVAWITAPVEIISV